MKFRVNVMLYENEEYDMKIEARRILRSARKPLDILKSQILSRGVEGVLDFRRCFNKLGDSIEYKELKQSLRNYGIDFPDSKIVYLFKEFDKNEKGCINKNEFIHSLTVILKSICRSRELIYNMEKNRIYFSNRLPTCL